MSVVISVVDGDIHILKEVTFVSTNTFLCVRSYFLKVITCEVEACISQYTVGINDSKFNALCILKASIALP
jgi:hypothetical protein